MKQLLREHAIFEIVRTVHTLMAQQKMTPDELAKRLNFTPVKVARLLKGSPGMSVRDMADIFAVLGKKVCITIRPITGFKKR